MITGNEPINYFEYETANEVGDSITAVNLGLTIRQHFAAMFTQAFINNVQNGDPANVDGNAEVGLRQADALIKALNNE